MAGHFCCCIPVRVGVFLTSFLGLVSSSIVGISAIYILIKSRDPRNIDLTDAQRKALIAVAFVYCVTALISLFGFIGAVIRERSFVVMYYVMDTIVLVVHTVFGIWVIYILFREGNNLVVTCLQGLPIEEDPIRVCDELVRTYRALAIIILLLVFLVHLYICVIIRRYIDQLDEEAFVKLLQAEETRSPSTLTKSHVYPYP